MNATNPQQRGESEPISELSMDSPEYKLLQDLALTVGQQVTDDYVIKNGLWEGLSISNVGAINKATVKLEALIKKKETEARIVVLENILESDAWDNPLLLKALIKGLIKELNTTEDKKGGIYYGDETDD